MSQTPIPPLPHPMLKLTWHIVTPEFRKTKAYYPALEAAFRDACRRPGWNPKTVQMAGFMRAIDYCASALDGSFHSYLTAVVVDHPVLATLPPHAPRAVRHPYRADVRLKYAVATEGWDFLGDINRADEAAERFNAAISGGRA